MNFSPALARLLAVESHGEQKYGHQPYSVHLDDVARHCKPFGETALKIAYLHDTLEDTNLPSGVIVSLFGLEVAASVELITDPKIKDRVVRKVTMNQRLASAGGKRNLPLAYVVKAADRLANVTRSLVDRNEYYIDLYRREHFAFVQAARTELNAGLVDATSLALGLTMTGS